MAKKRKRNLQTTQRKKSLKGKRLLAWCDSPRVATGFGNVAREILTRFAVKDDVLIDIIGVNDLGGWYDPRIFPFRIYPALPGASAGHDVYGREILAAALLGKHPEISPPWDFIWVLADHFILEQKFQGFLKNGIARFIRETVDEWKRKHNIEMKTIVYSPVDSPLKSNWVIDGLLPFDIIVTYTNYGKEQIIRATPFEFRNELLKKLKVIPHGVDLEVFKPLPREKVRFFKEKFFGDWLKESDFLVVNVNRNQPRKDIARTLEVFRRFNLVVPDSKLYIHAAAQDVGGNIYEMARFLGLNLDLLKTPERWNAQYPHSPEFLNYIYNSADVVISTTTGEGWGLSITEALAAERPVICHNVTSVPEILNLPVDGREKLSLPPGDNWRGLGVRTNDFISFGAQDLERVRPVADVEDFVEKLIWVYEHEEEALELGKRGRKWLQNLTWDDIYDEFRKAIMELC